MRKVIISLAPVKAGTPIDRVALAEDVKSCVEAGVSFALSSPRWIIDTGYHRIYR